MIDPVWPYNYSKEFNQSMTIVMLGAEREREWTPVTLVGLVGVAIHPMKASD